MDTKHKPIEISRVMKEFLRRWWFLLLSTILFGAMAYYATAYLMTPIYRTSSTIFIGREGELQYDLTIADINLSQRLAIDYRQLIMTSFVLEEVITRLPLEYRDVRIGENLRVSIVEDSRFMYIFFDDPNPQRATNFVNTLSEVLREKSLEIFGVRNMRVVDFAQLPIAPVRPSVLNNTAAGGFLGLLFSGILLLLKLVYSDTVKGQEDIEKESGLPVLGIVPRMRGINLKSKKWSIESILASDPFITENYRIFQAYLTYLNIDSKIRVLLFTSAWSDEGKTNSVSNLAMLLSTSGKKVLVIDCDLRRGNIHSMFNLKRVAGLTDYLVRDVNFEDVIKHIPNNDNLHILTTGLIPSHPTDILSSTTFKNFINEIKIQYDYILIDAPPVLLFSDAPFISMLADALILVVTCNKTRNSDLIKTRSILEKTGAHVLGVLLTKAETPHKQKFYSYHGKDLKM